MKIYTDISTHYSKLQPLAILALLFGFSYITACVLIHFYCCNRLNLLCTGWPKKTGPVCFIAICKYFENSTTNLRGSW